MWCCHRNKSEFTSVISLSVLYYRPAHEVNTSTELYKGCSDNLHKYSHNSNIYYCDYLLLAKNITKREPKIQEVIYNTPAAIVQPSKSIPCMQY